MKFGLRFLVPLILLIPAVAFATVPDITQCSIGTRATENVSVMLCPACDGYGFTEAQTFGGDVTMDATIEVFIRNSAGQGIPGVDPSTIWIDDPNLCWCVDGNIADFPTEADGYTEFAMPPCGGGCANDFMLSGYLNGEQFLQNPIPYIQFNSPDSNCDLIVDLIDLSAFAAAYFGTVTYCMDFYWDNVMDLRDLALFAQHYSHECAR